MLTEQLWPSFACLLIRDYVNMAQVGWLDVISLPLLLTLICNHKHSLIKWFDILLLCVVALFLSRYLRAQKKKKFSLSLVNFCTNLTYLLTMETSWVTDPDPRYEF